MEIFNMLLDYFGIAFTATTFPEFMQWLMQTVFALFLICFIFKCLFSATWRIGRELR